jgi:hypothetical protein
VEKEYSNKILSINQQRDKVLNSIECQIATQEQRQVDLEGQMDVMQLKFKVILLS